MRLITHRLTLRPFTPQDLLPFHTLLNEPGLLRYFPTPTPPSLERVEQMIARLMAHWDEHGYGVWAVEANATGQLLGRCGLFYIAETSEVEVDFIVDHAFWGQGFATEAARASLQYGFDQHGMNAIVGIVHPENKASQRVLEKIGMTLTRADNYFGMDCLRYEIRK
jgi:RimJ/RimL family protein N-acetyltransferase